MTSELSPCDTTLQFTFYVLYKNLFAICLLSLLLLVINYLLFRAPKGWATLGLFITIPGATFLGFYLKNNILNQLQYTGILSTANIPDAENFSIFLTLFYVAFLYSCTLSLIMAIDCYKLNNNFASLFALGIIICSIVASFFITNNFKITCSDKYKDLLANKFYLKHADLKVYIQIEVPDTGFNIIVASSYFIVLALIMAIFLLIFGTSSLSDNDSNVNIPMQLFVFSCLTLIQAYTCTGIGIYFSQMNMGQRTGVVLKTITQVNIKDENSQISLDKGLIVVRGAHTRALIRLFKLQQEESPYELLFNNIPFKDLSLSQLNNLIFYIEESPTLLEGDVATNLFAQTPIISGLYENTVRASQLRDLLEAFDITMVQKDLTTVQKKIVLLIRAILLGSKILVIEALTANCTQREHHALEKLLNYLTEKKDYTIIVDDISLSHIANKLVYCNEGLWHPQ